MNDVVRRAGDGRAFNSTSTVLVERLTMPKRTLAVEAWRRIAAPIALIAILVAIAHYSTGAMSYSGLNLLLGYATPLMFAAIAQMFIITAGDIDLGIGTFVGFINALSVTILFKTPVLGILCLIASVAIYACMGLLIHLRNLPAIVVTLSAGFIWLGLAVLLLPTPGGTAPSWLVSAMNAGVPFLPPPILIGIVLILVAHFLLFRTSYGTVLRGFGSSPQAIGRANWSLLFARMTVYALAGIFAVLAGLAVTGITTSGDANVGGEVGGGYTLLSIAAVILGGGEFGGGRISPFGAVVGAVTLSLVGSLLTFLQINSDYQIGVQGLILLAVLAARAVDRRTEG